MEEKTVEILVYGSLRKDEYNYNAFKSMYGDGFKYIKTLYIKGYDLYSLGSYPAIIPSENPDKNLIVDVIECSERAFTSINRMELGAGYKVEIVSVNDEQYPIYVYNYKPSSNSIVESGDWSKYLKRENQLEFID